MTGKIRNIDKERNFGFILGEDGKDYFFHASACDGEFNDMRSSFLRKETVEVEFEPTEGAKGLRAEEVRRL